MSYDVTFLPNSAGTSVAEIEQFLEEYDGGNKPPNPSWKGEAAELAKQLVALNPDFEVFESGTALELTVPEGSSRFAISVSLYYQEAAIAVPYWYKNRINELFSEMWAYAERITDALQLIGYDGQTGRLWMSEQDALSGVEVYAGQVGNLPD